MASDPGAHYDERVALDGREIEPTVTWGINPGQSCGVNEPIPRLADVAAGERAQLAEALDFMGLEGGKPLARHEDRRRLHRLLHERPHLRPARGRARGADGPRGAGRAHLVVPGSQEVAREAEAEGLPEVFRAAGFDWREPGCSMCLAMNPDKLVGRELCASSSNRNFKGRQGSPTGRTLLMSPAMVAAAALRGRVVDVREVL